MTQEPQNLSALFSIAILNNWYIIAGVLIFPIIYAILMKKFEKWAEEKI